MLFGRNLSISVENKPEDGMPITTLPPLTICIGCPTGNVFYFTFILKIFHAVLGLHCCAGHFLVAG